MSVLSFTRQPVRDGRSASISPLRDQDTLVFLGDYLDRGEDSATTVATLGAVVRHSQSCAITMSNDAQ